MPILRQRFTYLVHIFYWTHSKHIYNNNLLYLQMILTRYFKNYAWKTLLLEASYFRLWWVRMFGLVYNQCFHYFYDSYFNSHANECITSIESLLFQPFNLIYLSEFSAFSWNHVISMQFLSFYNIYFRMISCTF